MVQPWNLGPGLMDFSAIGQLGDPIFKAVKDRRDTDAILAAYDQSQGGQAVPAAPVAGSLAALGQSAPAPVASSYLANARAAESSGNDIATNPNSTATGRYQFLKSTWDGLAKTRPDLALTPDGRTDPAQQERAMQAFTSDNAKVLQAKGIQPTDGNLYMAHFLGAGAAPNFISAVQQDPSVPASSLVSPQVAAANRGVFFNKDGSERTAGEVYQRMTARFGGGSTAPVQTAQADMPAPGATEAQGMLPGAQPASRQNVNGQMIRGLLSNPGTRDIGKQLWAQTLSGKSYGFQVVGDQLYRTNASTGQVEPVSGITKPTAPVTVGENQTLVDPRTGNVIYAGAGGAPTTRQIKQSDGSEVVVQWDSQNRSWVPLPAPEGGEAVRPKGQKLTEAQSKDLVFHNRGIQALETFEPVAGAYASGPDRLASNVPGGNYVVSEDFQKASQAGRNFLASILRKDTGAAITAPEEKQYGEIFLPQPGDKPGTLAQKAEARKQAIDAIRNGLGTAEVLALGQRLTTRNPGEAAPAKPANDGWQDLGGGIRIREKR